MASLVVWASTVAAAFHAAAAWQTTDPWFDKYPETGRYLASDGQKMRLPLRLASHETVLYGAADMAEVMKDFEEEDFTPVSVGGKAAIQVWFNNFTDTDCGPEEKQNPYLETWFSLPVTPKSAPLDLPLESPMSYMVADPRALIWVHRVICGAAFNDPVPPMGAISGGREVWGFPKHNKLANIRSGYDGNFTSFHAEHMGKPVISMRAKLPEHTPGVVTVPQEVETTKDQCLTPRWSVKQTRYGQAFKATMHISPWDPKTDSIEVNREAGEYGEMLSRWNFQPAVKVHSTDFKIVAFKPSGWLEKNSCVRDANISL